MFSARSKLLLCFLVILSSFANAWTVDSLRSLAEAGNLQAAARLSAALHLGLGTRPDPVSALRWAQKAAESKRGYALFCLAECLRTGDGTSPRFAESQGIYKQCVELLRQEASPQDPECYFALATCFANGLALPVREDSSSYYLQRSAELLYAPAQHLYYKTPLTQAQNERDSMVALAMLRSAADQLYVPAMVELAGMLAQRETTEDLAFLYARRAAALGSAQGAYQCGAFRYAAVGVAHDTTESQKWFEQAAQAGLLKAHAELGYRHSHGIGVPLDPKRARTYYMQSLALLSDERPGLTSFIHTQLDSLSCTAAVFEQSLNEVAEELRGILGRTGHPAAYSAYALSSASRAVWRRVYLCAQSESSEEEYLALARNGTMRHLRMTKDTTLFRVDGRWTLSEDAQQLSTTADAAHSSYKVVILSPGMLVLRTDKELMVFERVWGQAVSRLPAFKGYSNQFGEVVMVARKAEITETGALRLRMNARNVPADGMVVSLDSIHLATASYGLNDRKRSFRIEAPEMIFDDGDFSVTVDVRSELRSSLAENHCILELSAVYAIDDAHRQCSTKTGEIALPQQMK